VPSERSEDSEDVVPESLVIPSGDDHPGNVGTESGGGDPESESGGAPPPQSNSSERRYPSRDRQEPDRYSA